MHSEEGRRFPRPAETPDQGSFCEWISLRDNRLRVFDDTIRLSKKPTRLSFSTNQSPIFEASVYARYSSGFRIALIFKSNTIQTRPKTCCEDQIKAESPKACTDADGYWYSYCSHTLELFDLSFQTKKLKSADCYGRLKARWVENWKHTLFGWKCVDGCSPTLNRGNTTDLDPRLGRPFRICTKLNQQTSQSWHDGFGANWSETPNDHSSILKITTQEQHKWNLPKPACEKSGWLPVPYISPFRLLISRSMNAWRISTGRDLHSERWIESSNRDTNQSKCILEFTQRLLDRNISSKFFDPCDVATCTWFGLVVLNVFNFLLPGCLRVMAEIR